MFVECQCIAQWCGSYVVQCHAYNVVVGYALAAQMLHKETEEQEGFTATADARHDFHQAVFAAVYELLKIGVALYNHNNRLKRVNNMHCYGGMSAA